MDPAVPLRTVVLETNPVYRRAIVMTLGTTVALSVEAESDTASSVAGGAPEMVVLGLEDEDVCLTVTAVRDSFPKASVVVLAGRSDAKTAYEAMRCGASGFVPKSAELQDIVDCVEAVARGDVFIHPAVAGEALRWATSRSETMDSDQRIHLLTRREREVLDLLSEGLSTRTIAERLYLSRRTVEYHLGRAYRKLDVHRGIEAIIALKRYDDAG